MTLKRYLARLGLAVVSVSIFVTSGLIGAHYGVAVAGMYVAGLITGATFVVLADRALR